MASKKVKFVNKYDNYKARKGTVQTGEEIVNKEFAEDCNIYNCIEKYGITALLRKTQAEDYYYDNFNNQPKTLLERIQQRQNLNEYFSTLPATVRKKFGDSADVFYQKFKDGDFNDMKTLGIVNDELVKAYSYKEETTNGNTEINNLEETTTGSQGISTDIGKGDLPTV